MFQLYAVQAAAASDEGALTFEKEDGETESLRLGEYETAGAALVALASAHASRTTRPSYADPLVQPPLWGHELYQRHGDGPAVCVARADSDGLTVTREFASSSARVEPTASLAPRWQ